MIHRWLPEQPPQPPAEPHLVEVLIWSIFAGTFAGLVITGLFS